MRPNFFTDPLRSTAALRSAGVLFASLVGLAALSIPTFANADDPDAHIQYRQALMDGVGADMAGISAILKNQLVLPGHVESHARSLAASAKLISAAFKQEVSAGPTDAKVKIWRDWSGFEKAIADLDKAANGLASAAAGSDPAAIGPAVKALGKSCGGCHKAYRKPKEESFKNKGA